MAFGGGSFVTQNKILPGVYVNVNQQSKVGSALSDRGVAALGLELDWGPDGELFYLEASEFRSRAQILFGYAYGDRHLQGLRDLFLHAAGCYFYRLNSGERAACSLAEARFSGVRGNALLVTVEAAENSEVGESEAGENESGVVVASGESGNTEAATQFVVTSWLDGQEVDRQQVKSAAELLDNDYICWKGGATLQAGYLSFSGGSNKAKVGAEDYQKLLEALGECEFNALGCLSCELAVQNLFVQYTREQREDNGRKFQTVLYNCAANYEGVINLGSKALAEDLPESGLVFWLLGAEAGCAVNATLTNAVYDGEIKAEATASQRDLQQALLEGSLVLHRLNGELRVLEDVNSLQNWQEGGLEDRRFNQTVRVLDQIVLDLAALFYQRYLGIVPNDNAGRISLWSDVVAYYRKLEGLRAIESFDPADVTVAQGENKKAVVISSYLNVTNAMSQLYLTVTFN